MMDKIDKIKALILSGGHGKRLRPLTETIPKPMLEIRNGFTILDKQLLDLKKAGVQDVFLLIGYLGNKIKQRYKDNWQGININYCEEEKPMGKLWAVKNGLKKMGQNNDVVLSNGDIVCDFSLSDFIEKSQKSDFLLTIFTTKFRSPYGILEIKDKKVAAFLSKPILNHYINGGIYYIKKQAFPYFFHKYPGTEKEIEKTVFPEMSKKGLVGSYEQENVFWESVDGFKDLERVRKHYVE